MAEPRTCVTSFRCWGKTAEFAKEIEDESDLVKFGVCPRFRRFQNNEALAVRVEVEIAIRACIGKLSLRPHPRLINTEGLPLNLVGGNHKFAVERAVKQFLAVA